MPVVIQARALVALIVFATLASGPIQSVTAGNLLGGRFHSNCSCVACPTIYRAGDDADDLQVHVVGSRFDTIEAYFRQEYYRETLPTANLHCRRVVLGPDDAYGTFAVQLGDACDSFKAYGWKQGKFEPTATMILTPEAGCCACLHWVTPRILKITWGRAKELVIRFNDSDEGWSVLYSDAPQYPIQSQINATTGS